MDELKLLLWGILMVLLITMAPWVFGVLAVYLAMAWIGDYRERRQIDRARDYRHKLGY